MYTRRLQKCKTLNFSAVFGRDQHLVSQERHGFGVQSHNSKEARSFICSFSSNEFAIKKYVLDHPTYSQRLARQINSSRIDSGCGSWWRYGSSLRFYSSEGDGGNTNNGHAPVRDSSSIGHGKVWNGKDRDEVSHSEEHARLGEQDQKEWLNSENLSFDNQNKDSPFLTRRERFKKEFLKRVIPWENLSISWDTFPYFISEHTKTLLMECAATHLKHKKLASTYGARLTSSSGRILLQGIPGTELYRERMVKALARDLQVPVLVLDSSIIAPLGCGHSLDSESDVDDDNVETGEECASCSEVEDDSSNEVDNDEVHSDESDDDKVDVHSPAEALKKLVPHALDELGIKVSGESESESTSTVDQSNTADSEKQSDRPLKKGDRVKYVGASVCTAVDRRPLSSGQRGEVYEVNGDKVAVILDNIQSTSDNDGKNEKISEKDAEPSMYWIDIQDVVHDLDTEAQDWYIAIESLCEILPSLESIIVYFSDTPQLSRILTKSNYKEFIQKLEEMFDQLEGPIILIHGRNKEETGPKAKDRFMVLPQIAQLGRMPVPLHRLAEGLRTNKSSKKDSLHKVFNNLLSVDPPKEEEALRTFHKQLDEDRRIVISRNNLVELHRVLLEHDLSCLELSHVMTDGVIITNEKAEQIVGWARNKYLSSCDLPFIKNDRLILPRESLQTAISRLKEQETTTRKSSQNLKSIAKDDYEKNFVSAVVPANEIGVRFEDIGALEDVKRTLDELVTLPMRRPELFSRGNLLRPCKGILLFGPPGTGKTLLAKALATEAGANFISITGSALTSKWFGDAEKLTKALFSFASRLAPVIIFVDEVDSLLGARGGALEHEATRRMRNEFMAAWDGLRTRDSQRILVLGATNRPFDLDDAVIRRLPRRIYVELPDAKNRMKILRIFLAQENLDPGFKYNELANETEGYSGSDLKNLCIAAAYRPVQELLDVEKKEGGIKTSSSLRPLNLSDFIQAKSKVGASVAYDAASMNELRKWNEQYGEGGSRRRSPFGFGD